MVCMPYLKFSDLLTETHLFFFIWPYLDLCSNYTLPKQCIAVAVLAAKVTSYLVVDIRSRAQMVSMKVEYRRRDDALLRSDFKCVLFNI